MRVFHVLPVIVRSLQFGPDARSLYLISGPIEGEEQGLELLEQAFRIDLITGCGSHRPFSGSEVAVFTPDMRWLYHSVSVAVSGGELDLRRMNMVSGESQRVYASNVPYPHAAAFTPNGHILAIGGVHYSGGDGRGLLHRLDVWHVCELDPIETDAHCLAYSPDGRQLAAGGSGYLGSGTAVGIWEGKRQTKAFAGPAEFVMWAADGRLAWGTTDRVTTVQPTANESPRHLENTGGHLTGFAFSSDSRRLLTGSRTGTCSLQDVATGCVVASFDWGIGPIHSVAFSPDGLTCAAGGEKGQVVVWDVDT
ncbi:WD40 repeat domain-containing protein [Gemmata sp.]|uniref:WD40 repeat domain-containing protein n=1 Tax=Gemmata sp. TaxID=1914242 RepID=UPI003F705213